MSPWALPDKLTKVADSDLAPWQKLEIFRANLIPSLSHHLATGSVIRGFLYEMDARCSDFLTYVSNVPHTAHNGFLYSDRRAGGLGPPSSQKSGLFLGLRNSSTTTIPCSTSLPALSLTRTYPGDSTAHHLTHFHFRTSSLVWSRVAKSTLTPVSTSAAPTPGPVPGNHLEGWKC